MRFLSFKGKDGIFIYSIQNPDHVMPFDVDPESGSVTLVRELDRETRENYTVSKTVDQLW